MPEPVPLESVLCTEELNRRPSRPPDYRAENRALVALAQVLADSPRTILQRLAEMILEVLQAGSAGISLLTKDEKRFHWPAIAGKWQPHIGGGTPRDFGPCGDVLDFNAPLLFREFEQRYTYFQPVTPATKECLLVPFYVEGKAVGTIWAIAHDDLRMFDSEDMRQLVSLGRFASSAYHTVGAMDALAQQGEALKEQVAARQQSQQELHRALNYAQAIVRTTRDPLVILNADLHINTANEAFYKTFKVSPADIEGRSFYDLGNGQWKIPSLRALLDDILPRNSFFNDFEVTLDFAKIGRRTMLLSARKLSDPDQDASARILLGIQDITEVLHFQTAAREGAEKFKLLFERSPLPKWAFDIETLRFVEVNEAAVQHYGYSRDEFLRMSVLDVCTLEAGDALKVAAVCPPFRLGERETCQHRKMSGEIIDVEVRSTEITLAGKRVWLSSLNDFTERKRAEEQVARVNEELEKRVLERTQELREANAALTRQAEELLRSNAELERFAYISSHDLQEPLRTISSFTRLLATRYKGKLDADADDFIGFVVDNADLMQQRIKDLLLYSRLSARGKRLEAVDFEVLWTRAKADLATEIDNTRAVLTSDPLPTVWGDAVQLGQVLQNLLANALKFRGAEPPRIHVSAKLISPDLSPPSKAAAEWVFSVSDNGIGIEPQYAERIFVLFKRLHTQTDYPGTGIGLSICKRIVESHGGRIWVSSRLGHGATFYFSIP